MQTNTMNLDDTYTWVDDYPIPENTTSNLLLLEYYDHFMNNIQCNLPHEDQVVATANFSLLMDQAESAMFLLFATGCMPSRDDLSKIDKLSKEHPSKYLGKISNHKHLSLLRSTKSQVNIVLELLEPHSSPELGDIVSWLNFHPHIHTRGDQKTQHSQSELAL